MPAQNYQSIDNDEEAVIKADEEPRPSRRRSIEDHNATQSPEYRFVALIMTFYGESVAYWPTIVPSILPQAHRNLAVTLSALLACGNLGLEYYWHALGGSRVTVRVLSASFVVTYASVWVLTREGWFLDEAHRQALLGAWFQPVTNSFIFASVAIFWLRGRPFVADLMTDRLLEEQMTHPYVTRSIFVVTALWTLDFFGDAFFGVWGATLNDPGPWATALLMDPGWLPMVLLVAAVGAPVYLRRSKHFFLEEHRARVEAWERDHPDVEPPLGTLLQM